jgi:LmbE family N-acetylglucosaminyl deacetylase
MRELSLMTGAAPEPLHLLCIGAHADDLEIGAGGTVLTLLERHPGSHVTWAVFAGSGTRSSEARASADELLTAATSFDVHTLGLRDGFLPYQGAAAKEAIERLREALPNEPDVILTHALHDRHQDHRALAELTWNTWRDHLVLAYEIPKYEGDLVPPNAYVPLESDVVERKLDHLRRHFASQRARDWYDDDTFLGLMRVRGLECRSPSRFAEAFHVRKLVLR